MAPIPDDFTLRLLVDAGIGPGLRVLDIGCGHGEVTRLVRELVGERGEVVGVDRDAGPLAAARAAAQSRGEANVTFLQGDFAALPTGLPAFDAAVGRRVLMYQPDAVSAVRGLARGVRPGGLMVFQEHDATMTPASRVAMPLHARAQGWLWRTVEREGADIHMGFGLHTALTAAGLTVEHVRAEALLQLPEARGPVGAIVRAVLPRIVAQGVATAEEIDIDTLDERLDAERLATNTTYAADMMFGAWARTSVRS